MGKFDIIIVGGGLVGQTFACAVADAGLTVALIEGKDPKELNADIFDGRCSAVAHSSVNIFKAIDVWDDILPNAGPIQEIYITDGNSPTFLHFGEKETDGSPMGYMVENRFLRRALHEKTIKNKNITFFAPNKYKSIEQDNHFVHVELESGEKLQSKLLVAADGRFSKIRDMLEIDFAQHDYKQSGIVCAVKHEKDHQCVAQERFLPAGPFAILPMADKNHSALVWTEKSELAPSFMDMSEKDFNKEVKKRFGEYLGDVELVGNRWSYPLQLTFAKEYSKGRICLLGDACHAIHPVAGQGLNLSWRDVAVLAELVVDTKNLGLDIGGETVLKKYKDLRKKDNLLMIAATDGLVRLFSNDLKTVKLVRNTGLAIVEKFPGLKSKFANHAMGKNKKLPKLAEGEKL